MPFYRVLGVGGAYSWAESSEWDLGAKVKSRIGLHKGLRYDTVGLMAGIANPVAGIKNPVWLGISLPANGITDPSVKDFHLGIAVPAIGINHPGNTYWQAYQFRQSAFSSLP